MKEIRLAFEANDLKYENFVLLFGIGLPYNSEVFIFLIIFLHPLR